MRTFGFDVSFESMPYDFTEQPHDPETQAGGRRGGRGRGAITSVLDSPPQDPDRAGRKLWMRWVGVLLIVAAIAIGLAWLLGLC